MAVRAQRRLVTLFDLQIEHLVILAILLAVVARTSLQPEAPNDFWWHMKAGEAIIQTGHIPSVDEYSFTRAGAPYDNYAQFWLAESTFYLIHRFGGLELVVFIHSGVIASAYGLLYLACRQVASWRGAAVGLLFALALGITNWSLRPQVFALPLAAALLWRLLRDPWASRKATLFSVPLLMLLWANIHGSWTLGLGLLAIWLVARIVDAAGRGIQWRTFLAVLRRPLILFWVSLLSVFINPRGVRALVYVMSMAGDPVSQQFGIEWIPSSIGHQLGAIFIAGFLLATILLIVSPLRASLFEILCYLVFAILSFKMIRGIIWFGLFMAPVVARHLEAVATVLLARVRWTRRARPAPKRPALNLLIATVLVLCSLLTTPWLKGYLPLSPRLQSLIDNTTPIAAVESLKSAGSSGKVFNDLTFGSYLIWAATPDYKVFIDPRLELYTIELVNDYFAIGGAEPGWDDKLTKYGADVLLLHPEMQAALIRAAAASPAWERMYADESAVVFVKRG